MSAESQKEKTLYLFRTGEATCVSHDSYIQMGAMSHSVEHHIKLNPGINWVETHWLPDIFQNRYKRASFQAHERVSGGKESIEERPRDFPEEGASRGLLSGKPMKNLEK